MSEPRRSFTSTGFLTFLGTWAASLGTMLSSSDASVRHWGAVGMVLLPALYLACSTLIKRARLRAGRNTTPGLLTVARTVGGKTPPDPGAP